MWSIANPRGDINPRSWMRDWEILDADVFSRPISQYLRFLLHPVLLRLSKWKAQVFVFSLFDCKVWHQRWLSEMVLGPGLILGNLSDSERLCMLDPYSYSHACKAEPVSPSFKRNPRATKVSSKTVASRPRGLICNWPHSPAWVLQSHFHIQTIPRLAARMVFKPETGRLGNSSTELKLFDMLGGLHRNVGSPSDSMHALLSRWVPNEVGWNTLTQAWLSILQVLIFTGGK